MQQETTHNLFDGEQVAADLRAHRQWWEAVLLDRDEPLNMIKLRDLPANLWNADTLFILATDESAARRLVALGKSWLADDVTVHSQDETQRRLGSSRLERQRLVSLWWD